jgi:hypothetical protein
MRNKQSPGSSSFQYDVFISYSHKADGKFAPALQAALGKIARPWYRRRAIRVFRDATTLTATPELWPTIQSALDESRYFILLASPEAATSHWVNQEVAYWLAQQRPDESPPHKRLLIALTDGTIVWSEGRGRKADFDWEASDALPVALRRAFQVEPLYVDFTWAKTTHRLSLNHKPWYENVARLAAAIRGIPLDELIGEDIRQHRITIASALVAVLLVIGLAVGLFSSWQTANVLMTEKRHQMDAERVLPQLEGQLQRVRDLPIHEIKVSFDPDSFFREEPEILELRMELDPLFTQPMSIFFAQFVEGRTWPPEFKLEELPYTAFSHGEARVDAKFVWFDRVVDLSQEIDATLGGVTPAFRMQFDGSTFQPGGPGIHLRQEFEMPSLQRLIDDKVQFKLIRHDPVARQATEIKLTDSDVDLRVLAYYGDFGAVSWIVLFDSQPSPLEEQILAGDYLVNRGSIERSVLLNLYPPVNDDRKKLQDAKTQNVQRLLETRDPKTDDERRMLARALYQSANLSAFRGDHSAAVSDYLEVMKLLEPLVLNSGSEPKYSDGKLMFDAAMQPVLYFTLVNQFDRAQEYLPNLLIITQRLIDSNPGEPDYMRWQARSYLQTATIAQSTGSLQEAATALRSYVDLERDVHRKIDNDGTRQDLMEALETSIELGASLESSSVPMEAWSRELLSLKEEMLPTPLPSN